jgi:Fe-S-cluster containining protein
MAEKLKMSVSELEEKYLSVIDTPDGKVDVLKMKDGCNFLDEQYRCTAIPAKPVLCDTYPIVFSLGKRSVRYEIDQRDCPMVHWKEYEKAVEAFATKGIQTLKEMKIPLPWLRMVALYDEFDVNYVEIDKNLAKSRGYETFYLEKILGYACNGYERKARRRGFKLLTVRFQNLGKKAVKRLDGLSAGHTGKIRKLASAYKEVININIKDTIAYLHSQKALPEILTEEVPDRYLAAINQGFRVLNLVEEVLQSFTRRLKLTRKYTKGRRPGKFEKQSVIAAIHPDFKVALRNDAPPVSFTEITNPNSKEFWEALVLLNETFLPNEMDAPQNYITRLKGLSGHKGKKFKLDVSGKLVTIWSKWVIVCARDEKGRFVGAADGALIVDGNISVFYFSHIAVAPGARVNGIGTALTAATLQAAEQAIPAARKALGINGKKPVNGRLLECELTEIEFADLTFSGTSTIKRMPFHGRLERKAIWPLRYAQPDTDYTLEGFDEKQWNSVPMFLAYRAFPMNSGSADKAVAAVGLMFDYFTHSMGIGAKWDKDFMLKGLETDGKPSLIPFPTRNPELGTFIKKTGTLDVLLKKYYPGHKFTRDYFYD